MSSLLGRSSTTKATKKAAADMNAGRPTDLLIARAVQWKAIVKGLLNYYQGLANAERHSGTEITKDAGTLPLPFDASAQFQQGNQGWQPTLYAVRDHTRKIADLHEGLAKRIDTAVVVELNAIKTEVKNLIHAMQEDAGKKADVVDKEREASTTALGKLGHAVATVGQNHRENPTAAEDPFIAHSVVERQLAVQVVKENELQSATLRYQRDVERLEADWSRRLQSVSKAYATEQAKFSEEIRKENEQIAELIAAVPAEGEWQALTSSEANYLIPQDAPVRDVANIQFPSQNHESTRIVRQGYLERKTRTLKKYLEIYLVLTAGGFLHAYDKDPTTAAREDDPKSVAHPTLSIYLPNSTLGPPASSSSSKHKFALSAVKSAAVKQSKFKLGGKKDHDYTFRARSHEEMLEWHAALEKLCGNTVSVDANSTTSSDKQGEVPTTVAGAGLPTESSSAASTAADEEESGSSEEEEEESEFVEASAATPAVATSSATEAEHELPGYQGTGVAHPEKKAHFGDDHAASSADGAGPSTLPVTSDNVTAEHGQLPAPVGSHLSSTQAAAPGSSA